MDQIRSWLWSKTGVPGKQVYTIKHIRTHTRAQTVLVGIAVLVDEPLQSSNLPALLHAPSIHQERLYTWSLVSFHFRLQSEVEPLKKSPSFGWSLSSVMTLSSIITLHSFISSFTGIQLLTECLSNKQCHFCHCCTLCVHVLAACGVALLSELPADSLLFFKKLSSVKKLVLCIKGLFRVERSRGVLEDTAMRWVCLGYQSQRLWSAAIIWSSAISPGSVHNKAARMRKTFSLAAPLRRACNMGHLNKRFPIWSFLYS